MNYPYKKYGRVTFTFAMSFSISMHSYYGLWALHSLKYVYVFKLKCISGFILETTKESV